MSGGRRLRCNQGPSLKSGFKTKRSQSTCNSNCKGIALLSRWGCKPHGPLSSQGINGPQKLGTLLRVLRWARRGPPVGGDCRHLVDIRLSVICRVAGRSEHVSSFDSSIVNPYVRETRSTTASRTFLLHFFPRQVAEIQC